MAARKIKLKDQLGRVISVPVATPPAAPVTPPPTQPDTARPAVTVWKLIREIPANIQKLAKLLGTGFTTRGPDGEWSQRQIEAGEGIDVADGDGVAGNPSIGLAELPDAGGGTLQKTLRDDYGRLAGTSAATTSDLAEGDNLYFTDARADARASAAVAAHVAAADPHPQYTTEAEAAAAAPVQSVNGQIDDVVLDASDVGADPVGSASAAVSAHVAAPNPHPQYQPALPAGTNKQFLRGDGAFSDTLQGPLKLTTADPESLRIINYGAPTVWVSGRAQGTEAAPTALSIAMTMMRISASGYDGTEFRIPAYIEMSVDGAVSAGSIPARIDFRTGNGSVVPPYRWQILSDGMFIPFLDNTYDIGRSDRRLRQLWAANGTINTSDAREKTPVRPLTPAELAASIELGGEIGAYQWLSMIEAKGDAARQHIGMTVQRAIEILRSHGLDPFAYGFICYDQWGELPEVIGEDGEVAQEYRAAGDRYSFRMDELLAFIARGLAHRLDAVEQRLAAAGL